MELTSRMLWQVRINTLDHVVEIIRTRDEWAQADLLSLLKYLKMSFNHDLDQQDARVNQLKAELGIR